MNGISNKYIAKVLSSAGLKDFRGVFSADNVSVQLTQESNFIIVCNLSPASVRKGSHFITLVKDNKELRILDSLALSIDQYPISLRKHLGKDFHMVYKEPIQDILSPFCGFYCIYFALNSRYDEIKLEPFDPVANLKNDDICVRNILRLLK
jgi:hypothetical protein